MCFVRCIRSPRSPRKPLFLHIGRQSFKKQRKKTNEFWRFRRQLENFWCSRSITVHKLKRSGEYVDEFATALKDYGAWTHFAKWLTHLDFCVAGHWLRALSYHHHRLGLQTWQYQEWQKAANNSALAVLSAGSQQYSNLSVTHKLDGFKVTFPAGMATGPTYRVLKDLRWCIRHHSSVEKSARLNTFGLFAGPRFDFGRKPVHSYQCGFEPIDPQARVLNYCFQ